MLKVVAMRELTLWYRIDTPFMGYCKEDARQVSVKNH